MFSYREYLQSRYRALTPSSTKQWPPVSTNKIFKLAMIQKEKIQRGEIDQEFVRLTLTGKIDDILLHKTPVELKNIFTKIKEGQKLVLIEGAPGSGKSTLALHICQEWAEGKLFQEFDIAILVRLRDPQIRNANIIEKLLPCRNVVMASQIGADIMETDGRGVLWVLDGWDELPSDLSPNSIINKLVRPGMSLQNPLHGSTVIVTSRPSSSADLHPLVSSRVEVLGFTPHELMQYFTDCLNGDAQAVQTLLDRIRENPAVEGSCYLPLNASIIVNCFLSDNHSLPTSNYKIFTSVVQSSLKRYLQDKLGKTTTKVDIISPDSLPSIIRNIFTQICRLAYRGIDTNKVTFTSQDLTALSIPKVVSDIGLMQTVPSILGDGHLVYYCFLHLSIQELLAAIHISFKSPRKQISTFQKLFSKPRFSAVFQFYAGITKLRMDISILNKLPRYLCPIPTSIFELVRQIIKNEQAETGLSQPLLISLLNCLYEAEDSSLCVFVADLIENLNFSKTTLNPIDCLSVGYFVSVRTNTNNNLELTLISCSISDQGCKFLTRGLSKCPHPQANLQLILWDNDIHDEGVHYIGELLKTTTLVSRLILNDNSIGSDGLSDLCEALSTNLSLKILSLYNCSLPLNNHGAIPRLLRTNRALIHLDLSKNTIGNIELKNICAALSINTTLKVLNLGKCSLIISDDNGAAFYQLLSENNSLEYLNLSENVVHTFRHIGAGLATNKVLKKLGLNNCTLDFQGREELTTTLKNLPNIEIGDESREEDTIKMSSKHLFMYNLL